MDGWHLVLSKAREVFKGVSLVGEKSAPVLTSDTEELFKCVHMCTMDVPSMLLPPIIIFYCYQNNVFLGYLSSRLECPRKCLHRRTCLKVLSTFAALRKVKTGSIQQAGSSLSSLLLQEKWKKLLKYNSENLALINNEKSKKWKRKKGSCKRTSVEKPGYLKAAISHCISGNIALQGNVWYEMKKFKWPYSICPS